MTDVHTFCAYITNSIRANSEELIDIWNYVGYEDEERQKRVDAMCENFKNILRKSIQVENNAVLEMNAQIEARRRQTAEACQALGESPYFPERNLTTCQLLQDLTNKLDELETEKMKRKTDYANLRRKIIIVSLRLGHSHDIMKNLLNEFPVLHYDSDTLGVQLPMEKDISHLQDIFDEQLTVYEPITNQLQLLKSDIIRLTEDIDYFPTDEKEKSLLAMLETDWGLSDIKVDIPSTNHCKDIETELTVISSSIKNVLPNKIDLQEITEWRLRLVKEKARLVGTSNELLTYLVSMWERLNKPEAERQAILNLSTGFKPSSLQILQNEVEFCQRERSRLLKTYLPRLNQECLDLARLCCVENQEIEKILQFKSNDEACADYLERRIEELKQAYQRNAPIYEGIASYQELWAAFLEIEQRIKDPIILANRGGILLKTEKEKKRILRDLNKIEQDVNSAIEEFEKNSNSIFLLSNGKRFSEAVEDNWSEFKTPKDGSTRIRKRFTGNCVRKSIIGDNTHPGAPS